MPYRRINAPFAFTDGPLRPIPPELYASDTFNRADTAEGNLGTSDGPTAMPWSVTGGWHISGNVAVHPAAPVGADRAATLPVNVTDVTVEATLVGLSAGEYGLGAGHYLVARFQDRENYYAARIPPAGATGSTSYQIIKMVAGTHTVLLDTEIERTGGDRLTFTVTGTLLSLSVNGGARKSITDDELPDAGAVGMVSRSTGAVAAAELDDFLAVEPS